MMPNGPHYVCRRRSFLRIAEIRHPNPHILAFLESVGRLAGIHELATLTSDDPKNTRVRSASLFRGGTLQRLVDVGLLRLE